MRCEECKKRIEGNPAWINKKRLCQKCCLKLKEKGAELRGEEKRARLERERLGLKPGVAS